MMVKHDRVMLMLKYQLKKKKKMIVKYHFLIFHYGMKTRRVEMKTRRVDLIKS